MNSQITSSRRAYSQRGQTFLVIVIFIAFFLLAVMGLATDYSQIWAHRQMAQAAADGACQAGAADLLLQFQDPTVSAAYPQVNFGWIGSAFNCSANTGSPVCKYASLNGYSGSNVSVSFPSSLPNAPPIAAGFGRIAHPYIQVNITDPVPMSFTKLVSSNKTFNISAKAGCGVLPVNSAVPITVLSPTASPSLQVFGNASIVIYGGPQKSIEVNSHSDPALSGGGGINLSKAGPSYTGGDIGVFGGPGSNPGVNLGSTGHYNHSGPITDPFATVPSVSSVGMPVQNSGGSGTVPHLTNGCPDTTCVQYLPGNYTGGIDVKQVTAIFDPGIYYVKGGITFDTLSNVRPSAKNDTTAPYGTIFYLTGCASSSCITVKSNSGTPGGGGDNFVISRLTCPNGGVGYVAPPGIPPPTTGNILMAPCTGPYGDPTGQFRGILFFIDHSMVNATASWGGGGSFTLAGAFYAHSTAYNDVFTMSGNSCSGSLVIGNMVVDTISMGGTPCIKMQLNPAATYQILKVELLQ